jgi:threonine/homoserine/homoserine lactone efflux protein
MEPLLKGIALGITVSFLIGPIFFALADITISKGWRCGLAYVVGVITSDIVLIYLVESILNQFPFTDDLKYKTGIVGGLLLIIFGVVTFFSKISVKSFDVTSVKSLLGAFFKGVTINVFNPFVTIWWITMYTTVTIHYISFSDKFLYYFGILAMVFLFDLMKIRFAYYLKQRLTLDKLVILKKAVGICLVVFGAVLIFRVN